MTTSPAVQGLYRLLELRERAKLADDLATLSDFALEVLSHRGGGQTRDVAAEELKRRRQLPACPICGAKMTRTGLGDWICHVEHVEPRWFAAEEVAV